MSRRTALLLSAALVGLPSMALALDNTTPMTRDKRLRVVDYNPDDVVLAYARPGQTFRIRLAIGERVVDGGVLYSDQAMMEANQPNPPPAEVCVDEAGKETDCSNAPGNDGSGAQSCDRNMCRSIVLNNVFIMPTRPLDPQSFFLRTEWCPEPGAPCVPGEYAIELHTNEAEARKANIDTAFFGIQYRYAAREQAWRAQKVAAERKRQADAAAEWRRNNPPPALPSVPEPAARWDLARCSSAPELDPDEAWTDGRTTFLRYNGTRRIPNVYERRADGVETLTQYATEPEPSGTVIRIGKVRPIFLLRDGQRASCVLYVGPDPEGRAQMAVAPIHTPIAGQPRGRRYP